MSSLDAPARRALRPDAVTVDVATLVAGLAAIVAGLCVHAAPALNTAWFHAVNELGPAAPALWSCLSVAGLGLAGWIYLSAFAQARPERVAQLLWILVVGGIVINVVKKRFHAARPLGELGDQAIHVIGEPLRTHSMPSGHSAMAFAMLALLLAERRRLHEHGAPGGPLLAPVGIAAVALFALGIALSRLAVGAHWPADALFGGGLGLFFGALAPHAWPVGAITRLLRRPAGRRLMALGLVVSAGCMGATPHVVGALGLASTTFARRVDSGYPLAEPLQWLLALVALAGAWRWWRAARAGA